MPSYAQYNLAGVGDAPTSLRPERPAHQSHGWNWPGHESLRAVPTSVTASEAYNALGSGVVDSVAFAPHAHVSYRVVDIANWWTTNLNPGTVNCPVVVNTDALNDLSDAHRKILLESVSEAMAFYVANYNANAQAALDKKIDSRKMTRVTFPDSEIAAARQQIAPRCRGMDYVHDGKSLRSRAI